MRNKGTLFFFCGKMGAGKSTMARQVASKHGAVLLSEDEWLAAHYPSLIHDFNDYITYSNLIKPFIKQHVVSLLQSGVNVVMDFPANTVKQRSWFLRLCAQAECQHEMYYLDISDEQCLAQIGERRRQQPERAEFDNEAMFRLVSGYFEAPALHEELNIVTSDNSHFKDSDE